MLVSISGSQSTGKSVLIDSFARLGYPVIERKTSRSILQEWGVTLQDVNNNRQLTIDFQMEIIKRKQQDELRAIEDEMVIWIGERTYADLFTYFLLSSGFDNITSAYLDEYYEQCMELQKGYSDVFYLQSGLFPIAADGVRSVNSHYSELANETMLKYTKKFTQSDKLTIIDVVDLGERINIIRDKIHTF
jgi:predicted ATPase